MSEHTDPELMLDAERDVLRRLAGQPLDFESLDAVSNIYRAAASVRRKAEREVLADHGLSWGGFTILWVLWVWGEMETSTLAQECGLAKGTLTGMLTTLGKQGLVERSPVAADRRRVLVTMTESGTSTIEQLFPRFNRYEAAMTDGLSSAEKRELARLLRIVITNSSDG